MALLRRHQAQVVFTRSRGINQLADCKVRNAQLNFLCNDRVDQKLAGQNGRSRHHDRELICGRMAPFAQSFRMNKISRYQNSTIAPVGERYEP